MSEEEIRPLRQMARLNQHALAVRSLVDRSTICLAERGLLRLRPEQLQAIEEVLRSALKEHVTALRAVLGSHDTERVAPAAG